jgi:hypothetical protein
MSIPFIEIPHREEAFPCTTRSPPRRLADVPVHLDAPGHEVLGDAGGRVPVHADGGALVHARAVVADVTLDLDLDVGVEPARERVRAVRIQDPPVARARLAREVVEALVQLSHRGRLEIDDLDRLRRRSHRHQATTPSRSHT